MLTVSHLSPDISVVSFKVRLPQDSVSILSWARKDGHWLGSHDTIVWIWYIVGI